MKDNNLGLAGKSNFREQEIEREKPDTASLETDTETTRPVALIGHGFRQVGLVILEVARHGPGIRHNLLIDPGNIVWAKAEDGRLTTAIGSEPLREKAPEGGVPFSLQDKVLTRTYHGNEWRKGAQNHDVEIEK